MDPADSDEDKWTVCSLDNNEEPTRYSSVWNAYSIMTSTEADQFSQELSWYTPNAKSLFHLLRGCEQTIIDNKKLLDLCPGWTPAISHLCVGFLYFYKTLKTIRDYAPNHAQTSSNTFLRYFDANPKLTAFLQVPGPLVEYFTALGQISIICDSPDEVVFTPVLNKLQAFYEEELFMPAGDAKLLLPNMPAMFGRLTAIAGSMKSRSGIQNLKKPLPTSMRIDQMHGKAATGAPLWRDLCCSPGADHPWPVPAEKWIEMMTELKDYSVEDLPTYATSFDNWVTYMGFPDPVVNLQSDTWLHHFGPIFLKFCSAFTGSKPLHECTSATRSSVLATSTYTDNCDYWNVEFDTYSHSYALREEYTCEIETHFSSRPRTAKELGDATICQLMCYPRWMKRPMIDSWILRMDFPFKSTLISRAIDKTNPKLRRNTVIAKAKTLSPQDQTSRLL